MGNNYIIAPRVPFVISISVISVDISWNLSFIPLITVRLRLAELELNAEWLLNIMEALKKTEFIVNSN